MLNPLIEAQTPYRKETHRPANWKHTALAPTVPQSQKPGVVKIEKPSLPESLHQQSLAPRSHLNPSRCSELLNMDSCSQVGYMSGMVFDHIVYLGTI